MFEKKTLRGRYCTAVMAKRVLPVIQATNRRSSRLARVQYHPRSAKAGPSAGPYSPAHRLRLLILKLLFLFVSLFNRLT